MLAPESPHSKSNVDQQAAAGGQAYRFRCPACQKLYAVSTDKVKGPQAEFECIRCYKHFAFRLPAGGYNLVPTYPVESPPLPQTTAAAAPAVRFVEQVQGHTTCPKCGATNGSRDAECWRCQVVLAKVKDLPLEMGRKASPAVVALWKQVVGALDKASLHDIFLKECARREQLEYAIDRYSQLVEAQPHDREIVVYLRKAKTLLEEQENRKNSKLNNGLLKARRVSTKTLLLIAPVFFSLILIGVGLAHLPMRNLVGLGAAVFVLYGGALLIISMPQKKSEPWVSRVQQR